jgi:TonB family protein
MNYQKFGDKMYPHDIRCASNGNPSFEATITKLQEDATPVDSQLFLPPAGSKEWPVCIQVQHPSPLSAPDPKYPGKTWFQSAQVVISLTIGADGVPFGEKITESGGDVFDQEALKTAARWRFRPATCAGTSVPSQITTTFAFNARQ